MRVLTYKLPHTMLGALLLVLTSACGDDNKGEGGEAGSESETSATGNTSAETGTATMGDGDGAPGDGDGTPGDGDGAPGDGDGAPGDGDGAPGDGDGDGVPGDGDGAPNGDCPLYETQDECVADPACQAVVGQPVKENGPDAPCFEPSEYIGCIAMQGCGDALTWFCVGGNAKPYLVPDTCGPDGAMMCDPGLDPNMPACP